MSTIFITQNLATKTWSTRYDNLDRSPVNLQFFFTNGEFNGLQFGYNFCSGSDVMSSESFPPQGVRYLTTDQEYVVSTSITTLPSRTYKLNIWSENSGDRQEIDYEFSVPKPARPFLSWVWVDTAWQPPVDYPTDGKFYVWNENNQSWDLNLEYGIQTL
jgi:hypothetical protein